MAQGGNYLKKQLAKRKGLAVSVKKKSVYSHKRNSAKYTKKGNPTKELRRGCNGFKKCGDKTVTAFIGNNIEEIMAARVLQSGSVLKVKDVAFKGKERLVEINRNAKTKKRDRVSQKLKEVEEAIERQGRE